MLSSTLRRSCTVSSGKKNLRTPCSFLHSRFLATSVASPSASPPSAVSRKPHIAAAVILNRAPFLTRAPSPFEKAFYSYQARIRRALHNPFPYDFYFKQGSLLETRFNMDEQRRERCSFGPLFSKHQPVDDEKSAANRAAVEQLAEQEGEGEDIVPRQHSSDASGDVKSLDRKGKRNLYLLLLSFENGKDIWRFPQGGLQEGDLLHQAAQKDLYAECGDAMDIWIVSHKPIGVYKPTQPIAAAPPFNVQQVVFFYKAHILAGQVKLQDKSLKDFAWLTKSEIETRVDKEYWEGVKDMLSNY